jgi:hypothetical protein
LYADDAAIFLTPVFSDVTNLVDTLQNSGDVTGLTTNVSKSLIDAIRCADEDLNTVLESFPTAIA